MVRATKWVKVNLFLSSYFPLWIILLVIQVGSSWNTLFTEKIFTDYSGYLADNAFTIPIVGILAVVSFWPLLIAHGYVKETVSKTNPENITIKNKEDMTSEYLLYIITYVFPFMTANSFSELTGIALGGALIIIGVLYIRANLFHVNPTLMLLYNYRLYKITDTKDNTYHLLSKEEVMLNGKKLRANSLNGIFYVEKPFEPKNSTSILSA